MSRSDEKRPDEKRPGAVSVALAQRFERLGKLEVDLAGRPPVEQALVAGSLFLIGRCARLLDRAELLVDEQRATARRGREILEMFPPLIGKLGELIEIEIAGARHRLEERRRR